MIHIIDNGRHYSDHALIFVETDMTADQVEEFLRLAQKFDNEHDWDTTYDMGLQSNLWCNIEDVRLLASAPMLTWRDPEAKNATMEEAFVGDDWSPEYQKGQETLRDLLTLARLFRP